MRKILISLLLFLTACSSLSLRLPPAASILDASPPFNVVTQPDGPLYVGDLVSFEVFDPNARVPESDKIEISLAGKTLAVENFGPFGMGARSQATFFWAWDTHGLQPGDYVFTFSLLPGSVSWQQTISLHPADEVPPPEPGARWETAETSCCELHYISGTDAEKDLDSLKSMVDTQAADVARRLGVNFSKKIPVTFLPRTLGHGGFTSDGIYVSYLHQNYAGSTAQVVTHHEMVHWLDAQMGGKLRPTILQEGLAVYITGGHFKIEPIIPRAASLLNLNMYIPLRTLANSFYLSQHEIGYAEAAALITYMINTYGWDNFNKFYRDIKPARSGADADALDSALQAHFAISLDQLEKNFLDFLRKQPPEAAAQTDMRLTVAFYDTVRRYQRDLDPSAYFLYTWLPDVPSMRQRGIVADFLRHPQGLFNRQIEGLLVSGDANLRAGNYYLVEVEVNAINLLLNFTRQP